MPWKKSKENVILQFAPPVWQEEERCVSPSESGSSRVSYVFVSSDEVNKRQLDPRIVDLQNLIDQGITIDPGETLTMLNLTDPAEIEQYNNAYVSSAYQYLKAHKDEIFKKEEVKS